MVHFGHTPVATPLRGLYAIIDVEACGARSPLDVAAAVLAGGCAVLQLRAKRSADREILTLGHALRGLCSRAHVPFVLNDRVELALAVRADGVHLGQEDMPIAEARRLAPQLSLGLSTHTLAQVDAAHTAGADLIGFGPVFATLSKERPDPTVGLEMLRQVVARARMPVVAIGGIDLGNVAQVAQTGVPLAAAIGALCRAATPEAAARALHTALARSSYGA